ncbi:acetyltransferase [Pseudoalteromonas sp. DL2-H2.2]|uniref:acetyltransferase n=1 Tax=Pseudoalteromonas sp. DL2-H2.2 TaxID=2908889 RepID=UPI001F246974|nr:acetyltransferase [Pseudoalteromonas sp. DL2-H2.2]MCF2910961.1 acetyltransferase [Pseudoalteromonas sp. DL2-H2.2]
MLRRFLPAWLVGMLATVILLANTLLWGVVVFALGLVKCILPLRGVSELLHWAYKGWCRGNRLALWLGCAEISLDLPEQMSEQAWYMLVANHISWLDIVVLSALERLPAPKFFLKDELKYVPLIGTGAWALGMPFMKRASKAKIAKNPKLKGMDVERTRHSCRHFRQHPTTVINFVEGTRFTAQKHQRQGGEFQYLLKPKAGGVAFALEVLAQQLDGMLDATVIYQSPDQHICRSFMCGKLQRIDVRIRLLSMDIVPLGNYQTDKQYRVAFQGYLNQLWLDKDAQLAAYWEQQHATETLCVDEVKQA